MFEKKIMSDDKPNGIKLMTSIDFISGTSRFIAASTPALKVIVDMLQLPQAPTNSNCTTWSSVT